MPTFGVNVDDATKGYVEEERVRRDPETGETDIVSRSQVIQELVRIGIAADKIIDQSEELDLDHGRPRESFVRQAVLNELQREGLPEP